MESNNGSKPANLMDTTENKGKHTELPWSINRYREVDNPYKIILYASAKRIALCFKEDSAVYHDEPEAEANAEFIVRACNSHYDLIEALQKMSTALKNIRQTYPECTIGIIAEEEAETILKKATS